MSGVPTERLVGRGYHAVVERDGSTIVSVAGSIHELNDTAAGVWHAFEQPARLDDVVDDLARRFRADRRDLVDDVGAATQELLAAGLLEVATDGHASPPVLEPEWACSGCGPGYPYEAQVVVQVGDAALAIGTDRELAEALAAGFHGHHAAVLDEEPARSFYGLVVPEPATTTVRSVPRLLRGPEVLVRARRPERAVAALVGQVAAHELPPGHLVLEAVAVGGPDGVVVVPVPRRGVAFERECEQLGLRVADPRLVVVNLAARTVVVGGAWFGFDEEPIRGLLATRARFDREDLTLPAGRYPVTAIGVSAEPGLARVLGELGPEPGFAAPDALERIAELVSAVPVVEAVAPADVGALLRAPSTRELPAGG